jgi:hypothetical protein
LEGWEGDEKGCPVSGAPWLPCDENDAAEVHSGRREALEREADTGDGGSVCFYPVHGSVDRGEESVASNSGSSAGHDSGSILF